MTKNHQAGFTLVEVAIAFAIIAIALVPISASVVHAYGLSSNAACLTQAAFLARHLVEEALATGAGGLEQLSFLAQDVPLPFPEHERFRYTRIIEGTAESLVRIEVCIYWHGAGTTQRYRVVTLRD